MLQPQLATLVDGPPSDPAEWLYEIKFDGYRILTRIDAGKIQLLTRNGNDWSHKLAHLVKAIGGEYHLCVPMMESRASCFFRSIWKNTKCPV